MCLLWEYIQNAVFFTIIIIVLHVDIKYKCAVYRATICFFWVSFSVFAYFPYLFVSSDSTCDQIRCHFIVTCTHTNSIAIIKLTGFKTKIQRWLDDANKNHLETHLTPIVMFGFNVQCDNTLHCFTNFSLKFVYSFRFRSLQTPIRHWIRSDRIRCEVLCRWF